jgi:hypothetical protein
MLRKKMMALATVVSLALLVPTAASARAGFGGFHGGGFHGGGFHGAGFHGGWRGGGWGGPALGVGIGLGLAGAYGGWGYPYGYAYPASYPYGGGCYYTRRPVLTPFGWHIRPARVCEY